MQLRSLNFTLSDFDRHTLPELYLRFCLHYTAAREAAQRAQ